MELEQAHVLLEGWLQSEHTDFAALLEELRASREVSSMMVYLWDNYVMVRVGLVALQAHVNATLESGKSPIRPLKRIPVPAIEVEFETICAAHKSWTDRNHPVVRGAEALVSLPRFKEYMRILFYRYQSMRPILHMIVALLENLLKD